MPADAPTPCSVPTASGLSPNWSLAPPTNAAAPRPTPALAVALPPMYLPAREWLPADRPEAEMTENASFSMLLKLRSSPSAMPLSPL